MSSGGGNERMKNLVDKLKIIGLKEQGYSNREVAHITNCDRKTIAKYWKQYLTQKTALANPGEDKKRIQEEMTSRPKYDTRKRSRRKFTIEIENRICELLKEEEKKNKILGIHKQQLSKTQIHSRLLKEGYDIGITTVRSEVNRLLKSVKECFVRQSYTYGDRLEYDFGEVKLQIKGKTDTYHMAVYPLLLVNFVGRIYIRIRKKKFLWIVM